MEKKLFNLIMMGVTIVISNLSNAQTYQTLSVTGFNADVIANGVGNANASTSVDVDGVNYNFVSRDFQATSSSPVLTYGIPANGVINSVATSGLSYQLASFSSNNSLRLATATTTAGTLTLATPVALQKIYVLAVTGSGSSTVTAVVNFTDATSQTFTNVSISDWYNGNGYAIQGIGRVDRNTNSLEDGGGTNPRLYQIELAIDATNQTKQIQNVAFTRTGPAGSSVSNIFALSGLIPSSCISPSNLTSSVTGNNTTINWAGPSVAPSGGYDYYYSLNSIPSPGSGTTPSGNVSATSVSLPGLTSGATYYFWVRSNCGGTLGDWVQTSFLVPIANDTCSGAVALTPGATFSQHEVTSTNVGATTDGASPSCATLNSNVWFKVVVPSSGNITIETQASASGLSDSVLTIYSGTCGGTLTEITCNDDNPNGGVYSLAPVTGQTPGSTLYISVGTYGSGGQGQFKVSAYDSSILSTSDISSTESDIRIYPNPFHDILTISDTKNVSLVTIVDASGRVVKSITNPQREINLSDLHSGNYFITLQYKDHTVKTFKSIKK